MSEPKPELIAFGTRVSVTVEGTGLVNHPGLYITRRLEDEFQRLHRIAFDDGTAYWFRRYEFVIPTHQQLDVNFVHLLEGEADDCVKIYRAKDGHIGISVYGWTLSDRSQVSYLTPLKANLLAGELVSLANEIDRANKDE